MKLLTIFLVISLVHATNTKECSTANHCDITDYCDLVISRCQPCEVICKIAGSRCKSKCKEYLHYLNTRTSTLASVKPPTTSKMIAYSQVQPQLQSGTGNKLTSIKLAIGLIVLAILLVIITFLFLKIRRRKNAPGMQAQLAEVHSVNVVASKQRQDAETQFGEVTENEALMTSRGNPECANPDSTHEEEMEKDEDALFVPETDGSFGNEQEQVHSPAVSGLKFSKEETECTPVNNFHSSQNMGGHSRQTNTEVLNDSQVNVPGGSSHLQGSQLVKKNEAENAVGRNGNCAAGAEALPVIAAQEKKEKSKSTDPKVQAFVRNKPIYDQLRRIPWIDGYYSEGRSIQIYVDLLSLTPEWVERELMERTGQPADKFRIQHKTEQD